MRKCEKFLKGPNSKAVLSVKENEMKSKCFHLLLICFNDVVCENNNNKNKCLEIT